MKIVDDYGELYRMSEDNYRRYLRSSADGENLSPSDFGGRLIGTIDFWTIDKKPIDYRDALDFIERTRRGRR